MNEQQAELKRFSRDSAYFEAHRDEFLAKYPEMWVAVFDQQVAGAAADLADLLADLRRRGVPPERAVVDRVTTKEETLILRL